MADNHYVFDRTTPAGFRLGRSFDDLENAKQRLIAERDTMTQMLDGDGSAITHFNAHVAAYGFSDTTNAKAAYEELNALLAKLDTDASVSSVKTAIAQALARFRN
jgi:hypothetical protein